MRATVLVILCWLGLVAEAQAAEARRGLVVLARSEDVEAEAESLARALYREDVLRPVLDESTVRAVLGGASDGEPPSPRASELRRVARAAVVEPDPAVAARLLRGLGVELGVARLVLVEGSRAAPVARVFAVEEGRFLSLVLSPRRFVEAEGLAPAAAWSDARTALRSLAEAPGSVGTPAGLLSSGAAAPSAPLESPSDRERRQPASRVLSSAWLWGGLAAVVTVGVTVLVLSRTTLDGSDTVQLIGRIAP